MKKLPVIILLAFSFSLFPHLCKAQDTMYVQTQNMVHMTSPPATYSGWGAFPADTVSYRKVYLDFTLGCPSPTCSGWDYTVDIYLNQNTHVKDSTLIQGPTFTVNGNQLDSVKVKKDTTYKTFYDTTSHVTDSTKNAVYTIVQYKNCAMPQIPTDTVYWWVAGYYNYYYNNTGNKIDSIYITPDTSMYLSHCPYYRVFDSIATYEVARMITPYGSYYNNTWTNPYRFDITDFSSLLHDSVQISVFYSGWTNGFLATCNFEMITGTPDHNPYKVINMWNGSFPYGSAGNPISNYLQPKPIKIDPGAYATRLRVLQTGHGEDDNNCTEFCANYNYIYVNNVQRYSSYVWRDDCGLNALWHQSGTWLFDRANWCPGDLVNPFLYDLTPYVTAGNTDTISANVDPYTSPNGGSIYIFGTALVFYGAPAFTLDAAVEDIIAPNIYAPYSRTNPICGSPQVVIRNTGSSPLISLDLTYGEVGGALYTYTWTGNLAFDDTTLVSLPPVDLKSSNTNIFGVTISKPNGGTDQYAANNYMQVKYDTVPTYPSSFVIHLLTNKLGWQYSYFIQDGDGNIILTKRGFGNSTNYYDTVNLVPGCYHFELDDAGEQGLSFFDNSDGNGTLSFRKLHPASIFNNFQTDFGTSVCQNFYVGTITNIDGKVGFTVDYNVYPNPAKSQLNISGLMASTKEKDVRIYSTVGELVYETEIPAGVDHYIIGLTGFSAGMYGVIISNSDGQVIRKVMVTK